MSSNRSELKYRIKVAVGVFAYLLAAVAFIGWRESSLWLSVPALVLVAVAGVGLNAALLSRRLENPGWQSRLAPALIFTVVAVAGAAVAFSLESKDLGFFFGAAVLLGIGVFIAELRRGSKTPRGGVMTLGLSVLVGAGAVLAMANGGGLPAVLVFAIAVGFLPIGLSLVSEQPLNKVHRKSVSQKLRLVGAGAVLLTGGLLLIFLVLGVNVVYLLFFGAAIFIFVVAAAARSNGDVVIVILVVAVIWTLTHKAALLPEELEPGEDDNVILAIGDSFMSGEGARSFFKGTNDTSDDGNLCRRAPTAFPVLLVTEDIPELSNLPKKLVHLACSGAKISEIDSQLERYEEIQAEDGFNDPEFVMLSVGGNDALFGSIGRTCVIVTNCTPLASAWTENLAGVGARLKALYEGVAEIFSGVPILVVPYPIPISETRCDYSAFSQAEHETLNKFTWDLNETIRMASRDANVHFVEDMVGALDGFRLCDGGKDPADVGVNFLAANSVFGTLEQSANPLNWVHNSLHPNALGHELMLAALVVWLVENKDDLGTVKTTEPLEFDGTLAGGEECRESKNLEACTFEFLLKRTARSLLSWGAPALLLIALGSWMIALPLLAFGRRCWASLIRHVRARVVPSAHLGRWLGR